MSGQFVPDNMDALITRRRELIQANGEGACSDPHCGHDYCAPIRDVERRIAEITTGAYDLSLPLTDSEGEKLHAAIAVVVQILDTIEPGADALLQKPDGELLTRIARRLDHERRHKGAVPNPNLPA